MKGDHRRVLADARDRGWTITPTRGGHLRLAHGSGALVIASATPSDPRALRNLAADLRRAERRAEGKPGARQ